MTGLTGLDILLAALAPRLDDTEYVFCRVAGDLGDYVQLRPIASLREREGLTLVLPLKQAERAGIEAGPVFRMITLTVHSSLEAVGLTAAVSARLAEHGISANFIAGYHHDHLFVPAGRAEEALRLLDDWPRQS